MGWLKSNPRDRRVPQHTERQQDASLNKSGSATSCTIERNGNKIDDGVSYPFVYLDVDDEDLPSIPNDEVRAKQHCGKELWIVIDNIVYDCSIYVGEHPGGQHVVKSFSGQDCSWQFWRFHSKELMRDHGRSLRIGKTSNIENRFKERPRFFGMKGIRSLDNEW